MVKRFEAEYVCLTVNLRLKGESNHVLSYLCVNQFRKHSLHLLLVFRHELYIVYVCSNSCFQPQSSLM